MATPTSTPARRLAMKYATRNPAFACLTPRHHQRLRDIVTSPALTASGHAARPGKVVTDAAQLETHNCDWLKRVEGAAPAVVFPTCTEQVAMILRYCNEENLAVVPQGGNTGLVYGSTPVHDELVLSTRLMCAAPVVDLATMSAEVDAGVILAHLQDAARDRGLLVPWSMGSKGSCHIGGNISTNAGGTHFARYGSVRSNILGLEAVTAEGNVLNMMSSLRKDNAGYDMKQLFIGSEGTLGIVTRAVVKLYPYPKSAQLALFRLPSFEGVLEAFHMAQAHLGECLSAFEVMDAESLRGTPRDRMPFPMEGCAAPVATPGVYRSPYFCVLLETNGSNETHDFDKLSSFVGALQAKGLTGGPGGWDPILSQSEEQFRQLWSLREDVPVNLVRRGVNFKFDVSFPLHLFYSVVEHTRELVYSSGMTPEEVSVVGYGHFGDGNVHLNVVDLTRGTHRERLEKLLYPNVYEFCANHHGSISAEHGIGLQKKRYLSLSRTPEVIALMHAMKHTIDPKGMLNPYKML